MCRRVRARGMTWVGAIASQPFRADALRPVVTDIQNAPLADPRTARKAYAARRWADLRDGITMTTPQAVGRGLLAVAVVGGSLWLAVATWPTLLPFLIGGLIAYTLLPVVDALDQMMKDLLLFARPMRRLEAARQP